MLTIERRGARTACWAHSGKSSPARLVGSACIAAAYNFINEIRLNLCVATCSNIFRGKVGQALEILLFILGGLLVAFVVASCSGARSYFEKGRFQGMEEATREIIRGLSSHYELEGRTIPERVTKAVEGIKAVSQKRWKTGKGETDPYHAQLWIFGDAVGEACWLNGQAAGVRRKAPAQGKVRIDLSLNELLQLSWLAHLGFQHMMPNYRGFEIHRFTGEEDALEGTLVVGKIESAIPARVADLSVQLKSRQKLIRDWWHAAPRDPYSMRDRKSHEAIT